MDRDGDGFYSEIREAEFKPGVRWKLNLTQEDCDDLDPVVTDDCSTNDNCVKRTGLLQDANFSSTTPGVGNQTTTTTDNFRNDSWELIQDANCGSGKIPKGSQVKVTDANPVVRTLADGRKLNYYRIEYEDCPKGNNSNSGAIDENKPCSDCFKGNPIKNMNLAKQRVSGLKGATFGMTRTKKNASGKIVPKLHGGVDLETKVGDPIYAMFDGVARLKTNLKRGKVVGAGYYVAVNSVINGKNVETWYFHMRENDRVSGDVKAGDIIGYQGLSGNLGEAVERGMTPIHVHIQLFENGQKKDPLPFFKAELNKETGIFTNDEDCK